MANIYRIHPAIGIARLGDSPDEYYVGPEAPGVSPSLNRPDAPHDPNSGYKDDRGRIKRQGARFRIYEYTLDDAGVTTQVREITAADAQIEWEVHLVNRKAAAPEFPPAPPPLPPTMRNSAFKEDERSKLVIDAGSQKIGGTERDLKRLQGRFMEVDVPLGDLLTDSAGRLIVLGGLGKSQSPSGNFLVDFANNDGWCDDTSDGPVRATIRLNGSTEFVEAEAAWVIVAPPDYAPDIDNVITLYDVVYNIATNLYASVAAQEDARTISFTTDIYPILRRPTGLHWVSDQISIGHGRNRRGYFIEESQMQLLSSNDKTLDSPAFDRRTKVFARLRRPVSMGGNVGDMPRLPGGDEGFITLTEVQYRRMEKWAEGEFEADWPGQPPEPPALDDMPVQDQPTTLDRAALESCVGGGFYPGIEVSRLIREPSTHDQTRPFRIASQITAGALTAGMAVPWQADFRDCDDVGFSDWWPGQRPVEVFRGQESVKWVPSHWPHRPNQPPPFPPPKPTDEDWDRYYRPMVDDWSQLGFVVKEEGTDRYVEDERSPTVDNGG